MQSELLNVIIIISDSKFLLGANAKIYRLDVVRILIWVLFILYIYILVFIYLFILVFYNV